MTADDEAACVLENELLRGDKTSSELGTSLPPLGARIVLLYNRHRTAL
jgi:hypothetical protein